MKAIGKYREGDWKAFDPQDTRTWPAPREKILLKVRRSAFHFSELLRKRIRTPEYMVFGFRCSRDRVALLMPNQEPLAISMFDIEIWRPTGQVFAEDF